jgi:hypothetical protein
MGFGRHQPGRRPDGRLNRPDVAAPGNPSWTASGLSATLPPGTLPQGPSALWIVRPYPGKGWWYSSVSTSLAGLALRRQFVNGDFELTFQPSSCDLNLTDNQLTSSVVFAHSSVTGRETTVRQTVTVELP